MPVSTDVTTMNSINGKTFTILNYIRNNASSRYADIVPAIPNDGGRDAFNRVGESIVGNPGIANEFLSTLVNEIALKLIKSANFNNYFKELKKGELVYGEIIEEIFVNIAELRDFTPEKGPQREFARTLPKVQAAFHKINFEGQYTTTIDHGRLEQAFRSPDGVTSLIEEIVASLSKANEYDEWVMFSYLMQHGIVNGKMKPFEVNWDAAKGLDSAKNLTKSIRRAATSLRHMRKDMNSAGVLTNSNSEDLFLIVDGATEADLDVELLATAFNIDRAQVPGRLIVIDDWTSFDNERLDLLREKTDQVEEITATDKATLGHVKAVLVDRGWFQVYDQMTQMAETYVGSGNYTNFFLSVRKVYATSPFHNAIVFVDDTALLAPPATVNFTVSSVTENEKSVIVTLDGGTSGVASHYTFDDSDEANIKKSIAVLDSGVIMFAKEAGSTAAITANLKLIAVDGTEYGVKTITSSAKRGDKIAFTLPADPAPAG